MFHNPFTGDEIESLPLKGKIGEIRPDKPPYPFLPSVHPYGEAIFTFKLLYELISPTTSIQPYFTFASILPDQLIEQLTGKTIGAIYLPDLPFSPSCPFLKPKSSSFHIPNLARFARKLKPRKFYNSQPVIRGFGRKDVLSPKG